MNSVQSEGGPFIIMDSALASSWGGVLYKSFMDEICDGASDYDALCNMLSLPVHNGKGIVTIQSGKGQALVLEMPFEATILFNDPTRACIVQAHYSDPEWSAEGLNRSVLDLPTHQESDFAEMYSNGNDLVIFDSTCDYEFFRQNTTSIRLPKGIILAKYSMYIPDERTMITIADLQVR